MLLLLLLSSLLLLLLLLLLLFIAIITVIIITVLSYDGNAGRHRKTISLMADHPAHVVLPQIFEARCTDTLYIIYESTVESDDCCGTFLRDAEHSRMAESLERAASESKLAVVRQSCITASYVFGSNDVHYWCRLSTRLRAITQQTTETRLRKWCNNVKLPTVPSSVEQRNRRQKINIPVYVTDSTHSLRLKQQKYGHCFLYFYMNIFLTGLMAR